MREDLLVLDNITLNFSQQGLLIMNIAIGFIMFGVALNIEWRQFLDVFKKPRTVIVGMIAQYLLLPFLTFVFVFLTKSWLTPAIAFGMILVAACPGGNVSNFISNIAKANTALSVSLTAIATVSAIVLTPFNFSLYGKLYSATSPLLRPIVIDPLQMFQTVFILLGIPVIIGIFFSSKFPILSNKIKGIIRKVSIIIFIAFVLIAFRNNYIYFVKYIKWIFLIVLIHNLLALSIGFYFSRIMNVSRINSRTISIETGIQNSGLALILIFNPKIFPPELHMGGMAFIAAWWGIWHIISGLLIAVFWGRVRKIN